MTTTDIEIPGYIARAKTVADLARAAADLLEHAADSGLPVPDMARLSTGGQEVSVSFPGRKETFRTLAQWAERFGGTVTGEPYTREDGEQSVYCQVRFPYLGVSVEAYAFIPADQTVSTT
jgi:hypothetical protein